MAFLAMNFTAQVQALFDAQRTRIEDVRGELDLDEAFEALRLKRLDPENIDRDCCAELKRVMNKRFPDKQKFSNRLDGHGWSTTAIANHMDRFLRTKLDRAQHIVRTFVDAPEAFENLCATMDPELMPRSEGDDTFEWSRKFELEDDAEGTKSAMASSLDALDV